MSAYDDDGLDRLASHNLEGMEAVLTQCFSIIDEFRSKGHDVLDYNSNAFDRDYVEFNVRIMDLEAHLQQPVFASHAHLVTPSALSQSALKSPYLLRLLLVRCVNSARGQRRADGSNELSHEIN